MAGAVELEGRTDKIRNERQIATKSTRNTKQRLKRERHELELHSATASPERRRMRGWRSSVFVLLQIASGEAMADPEEKV